MSSAEKVFQKISERSKEIRRSVDKSDHQSAPQNLQEVTKASEQVDLPGRVPERPYA